MTLFNVRPNRCVKTGNVSIIALSLLLNYITTKITLKVLNNIQEETKNNKSNTQNIIYNLYGRNWKLNEIDTQQLSSLILSYIANEENLLIKNKKIKKLIFILVKSNLNGESILVSPNLFRFLALNLVKTKPSLIVEIARTLEIISKRLHVTFLTCGFATVYYIGVGPLHLDYFKMPIEPVGIISQSQTNLITKLIRQTDRHKLYTSFLEKSNTKMELSTNGRKSKIDLMKNHEWRKSHRKSRMVRFDEFKKNDPVLKYWNLQKINLDEFRFIIDYE